MGATGSTTVDFGAFPGVTEVTKDIATAGVVAGSLIEAWVLPITTASHDMDEHLIENIRVIGRFLSAGNIRIHAYVVPFSQMRPINYAGGGTTIAGGRMPQGGTGGVVDGLPQAHRLHGLFTVAWAWL